MHPSHSHLLKFFTYAHLPEHLAAISAPFCKLANTLALDSKLDGIELTVCLRKLLESKDAAVRAAL